MGTTAVVSENIALDDSTLNLPEHMEWVDGQLIKKNGMTLRKKMSVNEEESGFEKSHETSDRRF